MSSDPSAHVVARPAEQSERAALARVLGEAFVDYPWTRWTVPGEDQLARLTQIQHAYLDHAATHGGHVWTTSTLDAGAVLIPASMPDPAPDVAERIIELHGDGWARVVAHEVSVGGRRPPADWTLATVGVLPAVRGRGLGTAVLESALSELGEDRVLLETSAIANVRLYERLGFRVVEHVLHEGPEVWIMLR